MKKSEGNQNNLPSSPDSPERYEIRFSGSGGQGIITAAIILAEAVTCYGKHQVCQTQSYGPEARGGTSRADVVISTEAIDYPKAMRLDLLLAMNQASCDAYFNDLKPHGLLIVDSTLVTQIPTQRAVAFPFSAMARQIAGKTLAANLVALGVIGPVSNILPLNQLSQAIRKRIPSGTEEMNMKAFQAGVEAAKTIDWNHLPATTLQEDDEL